MPDCIGPDAQLAPEAVRAALHTTLLPRAIHSYAGVGSTQDLAREQAAAGEPEGLLVLADEQTMGRGRLDRRWVAPRGSSLLCSLLLRPTWLAPAHAFSLTMMTSVALADAVAAVTGLETALKWPNDLLLPTPAGWRKAAGILIDLELDGPATRWAIIGCGLNVSWDPATVPDLAARATSVVAALGAPVDRLAMLQAYLRTMDARYASLRERGCAELFVEWRARLATLGQDVLVDLPGETLAGRAEDVDAQGALLVRLMHGERRRVVAGDVRLRTP